MTNRQEQRRVFNRHKAHEIVRLLKVIVSDPVRADLAEYELIELLERIFNHEDDRMHRW